MKYSESAHTADREKELEARVREMTKRVSIVPPSPQIAAILFGLYKKAFMTDKELLAVIQEQNNRHLAQQPVTGVTEKLDYDYFYDTIHQPDVVTLILEDLGFLLVQRLNATLAFEQEIAKEYGPLHTVVGMELFQEMLSAIHAKGDAYSLVELSSETGIQTAALFSKLQEVIPADAWITAKVLNNASIRDADTQKISNANFQGNMPAQNLAARIGMRPFASVQTNRLLEKDENTILPAHLAFGVWAGKFGDVQSSVLKDPDHISIRNFPRINSGRRTILVGGIAISTVLLLRALLDLQSSQKPQHTADIRDGSLRALTVWGQSYTMDEAAESVTEGKLVPLLQFHSHNKEDIATDFSVQAYGFAMGEKKHFAFFDGEHCIVFVNDTTENPEQQGFLFFQEGMTTDTLYPRKDLIGSLSQTVPPQMMIEGTNYAYLQHVYTAMDRRQYTKWATLDYMHPDPQNVSQSTDMKGFQSVARSYMRTFSEHLRLFSKKHHILEETFQQNADRESRADSILIVDPLLIDVTEEIVEALHRFVEGKDIAGCAILNTSAEHILSLKRKQRLIPSLPSQ